MKVEDRIAQGIASQLEWVANKVGNHGTVKRFAISWDGESEQLQGEVTMDAGSWIRSVLVEQEHIKAMNQHAYEHGVAEGRAAGVAAGAAEPGKESTGAN